MWLDEADGFAEIFRGYLPFYLFVALPIFIIIAPVGPVAASHEFTVYRMQQYDLHSVTHGCRSVSFNLEGRSLTSWATSRHCAVARIQDITIDQFIEIRSKAGALLVVLPKNDTNLTTEEKEHIQLLEMAMLQQEVNIPVYFVKWSPDMEEILGDMQHSMITDDKAGTALEAMINGVSSNGYQIVVSAPSPQKLESRPVTIHGKLNGKSSLAQTIVIAAQFDASGVAPDLALGADSNGSGVVALLELARIFSRLYSTTAMRGGATLVFMLTSVGHSLNYLGAKRWLEDQLDTSDTSLLSDVSMVLCLDSVSSAPEVVMHVSKPPKPGGPAHSIKSRLGAAVIHKKINLADEALAWQHERFSIRRMTAFTLSSLQSHKEPSRFSILDTPQESSVPNLVTNIRTIARALASHIYNMTNETNNEDSELYDEVLAVEEDSVKHWFQYLSLQSRAPQMITTSTAIDAVSGSLERALGKYMEVAASMHLVDKREPQHVLYGPTRATLNVYTVKPAVFDLILTLIIVAYLTVLYFAIQYFPNFYKEYAKIVTGKTKVH